MAFVTFAPGLVQPPAVRGVIFALDFPFHPSHLQVPLLPFCLVRGPEVTHGPIGAGPQGGSHVELAIVAWDNAWCVNSYSGSSWWCLGGGQLGQVALAWRVVSSLSTIEDALVRLPQGRGVHSSSCGAFAAVAARFRGCLVFAGLLALAGHCRRWWPLAAQLQLFLTRTPLWLALPLFASSASWAAWVVCGTLRLPVLGAGVFSYACALR